jgi:VWFA-related protein
MAAAAAVSLGILRAHTPQDPQRPVFRTGTSLVRVDAYPSKDGRIIEGLTAEDFEVLEDGVPQKIESFQFIRYERNTPADERRDPNSQREGFQLAADPSYRVFVIYLDNLHVDFTGSHAIRRPLVTFLNQVLGSKDLFGVLTTRHGINDLMLGQKTEFIEEQLTKYWDWGTGARVLQEDEDLFIQACYPKGYGDLIHRRQLDAVFSGLEGLITALAGMREERKNILLVSDGWVLPGRGSRPPDAKPIMPGVGVTDAGKLTMGRTRPGEFDPRVCEDLMQRLMAIDFRQRMVDLLRLARQSNVTFYTIRPAGLTVSRDRDQIDSLLTLSNNTDGIAVVNTNDLTTGAMRIGYDLSGSYILAYYPTNTKADGRIRKITVRLKGTKEVVRARRDGSRCGAAGSFSGRQRARRAEAPAPRRGASLARHHPRRRAGGDYRSDRIASGGWALEERRRGAGRSLERLRGRHDHGTRTPGARHACCGRSDSAEQRARAVQRRGPREKRDRGRRPGRCHRCATSRIDRGSVDLPPGHADDPAAGGLCRVPAHRADARPLARCGNDRFEGRQGPRP